MAINLAAPLVWTKANAEEEKMLECLQGNILKGHGRPFTANIFFRLDPNPTKQLQSKRMLRHLANYHLTNAHKQLLDTAAHKKSGADGGPFAHLALSFAGYQALGLAASAPNDLDFRNGMKHATSLGALADPPVNTWEAPFQQPIDGMVLAATSTESATAALAGEIREQIEDAGGTIVHIQHGKALFNAVGDGIENFGYVDGRSQPLILQEDIDEEAAKHGGTNRWDPAFPLSTALVKDPGVPAGDTVSFGSFFIFRKLDQDVRGFKMREQQIADVLGLTGDARELAGAMIVGRFEDGTPVTMSAEAKGLTPPNNFNYTTDPGGRCPFHAHIRKTNPRGTGGAQPEPQERAHLMARRGIPFEDVKRLVHPAELPEAKTTAEFVAKVAPMLPAPSGPNGVSGVGLLFMAYNAVIAQQFKFTQQTWANNTNFPLPGAHGIDPVIGQGPNPPADQKLPKEWDNPAAGTNNAVGFSHFVKMRGGEYMFSPSLTFLINL
jgi:Dyp-type peroxidase family